MTNGNHDKGQPPAKSKQLTLKDSVRCCDWLKENWEKIQQERPTRYQLRGMMREALHLSVSDSSLTRQLAAIDKKLPQFQQVKRSEDKNRVRRLARLVHRLYKELGIAPPEDLLDLAGLPRPLPEPESAPAVAAPPEPATPQRIESLPKLTLGSKPASGPPQPPSKKEVKRAQQALAQAAMLLKRDPRVKSPTTIDLYAKVEARWLTALRRAGLLESETVKAGFAVEAIRDSAIDELLHG